MAVCLTKGEGLCLLQSLDCLHNAFDGQRDALGDIVHGPGVFVLVPHLPGYGLGLLPQGSLIQRRLEVQLLQNLGHLLPGILPFLQLVPHPLHP